MNNSVIGTNSHLPRKMFHGGAALFFPLLYLYAPIDEKDVIMLALVTTFLWAGIDITRLFIPAVQSCVTNLVGSLMKEREKRSLTGATWMLFAVTIVFLFFDKKIAVSALLIGAIGDPVASVVGKRFGRIRYKNGRSFEGSSAFVMAGSLAVYFVVGLTFAQSLLAGVAGAFAEAVLPISIDDNFTVPLASAITLGVFA